MSNINQWQPEWSSGIQIIDDDHKKLFHIIKKCWDSWDNRHDSNQLSILLDELIDYVNTHFAREEQHLEQLGAPKLQDHRYLHADLKNQVVAYYNMDQADKEAIGTDVLVFLENWLVNHILKVDVPSFKELVKP
ncbi:bacteriohemerythrin [Candidatus Magnetaquicoccus inordinatus]|uniref:bacteriohemerythrin n=1 Tax=Candidatus Magnetaquicoccus inordinatus TaxID=2496818 RepID=UPI00102C3973|nr:bacteriohemerythrin [Candidatus Magnetaquicoccus inordinatus]